MSKSSSQSSTYFSPSMKFSLSSPVNSMLQNKIKSQNLRLQFQDRLVDLGNLQTEWCVKESELRGKSENLITQLRTLTRQFENKKNEEKNKHLLLIDQINREHQLAVLELQSQIRDSIEINQDEDDFTDLDQKIANVKLEIQGLKEIQEKFAQENAQFEEEEEENDEMIEKLEDRISEMKILYQRAVQQMDDESKSSTHQLEELILKQQEIDDQNQLEIQQLVEEINNVDRSKNEQIFELKKKEKETKRQISQNLKSAMTKAAQMQQEISQYHHDHKQLLARLTDEENQFQQKLTLANSKYKTYINESTNAAKKCSNEKRRIATMKHEIEELKGELLRESIEHANLMKEANKIDDDVLNQISEQKTTSFTFSSSFTRF